MLLRDDIAPPGGRASATRCRYARDLGPAYRALVAPLACYVAALHAQRPELTLTVVLAELVVRHRLHRPLHNGTARRLRRALRRQPGVIVAAVPLHLPT